MTARRRLAILACGILLVGIAGAMVRIGATAQNPSAATFLCDGTAPAKCASGTSPYSQSNPSWELQVVAGDGVGVAGSSVTLSFLEGNGDHPDRAHAFSFYDYVSAPAELYSLPPGPAAAGATAGGICPQASTGPAAGFGEQQETPTVTDDPLAQGITITMQNAYPAGTLLAFCFGTGNGGAVGFPATPGPYKIRYKEAGTAAIDATYNVASSSGTGVTSTQAVKISDPGGHAEVTDAGLGGSAFATYGTTYPMTIAASAGAAAKGRQESLNSNVFDFRNGAALPEVHVAFAQTGVDPTASPCGKGEASWCLGADGTATGTVTVTGGVEPVYVSIDVQPQTTATTVVDALVSLSVAAPGTRPVTPPAPPSPSPVPSDRIPPLPNNVCAGGDGGGNIGLGSLEVYDAIQSAFFPKYQAQCPPFAAGFRYSGSTDALAMSLIAHGYAFAGMDRFLTTQEYQNYTSNSSQSPIQFPIYLQPLVVTYNLPQTTESGCKGQVQLSSKTLSLIFAGNVPGGNTWNNIPAIQPETSANLSNCHLPILVAHDVGVASLVLKDYMSKRNPGLWKPYMQPQLADSWPPNVAVSCTANGSQAMAMCVQGQPGTIGYGFYREIHAAGLPYAYVDNSANQYPTVDPVVGCTNAAATDPAVPTMPNQDWGNSSITDWTNATAAGNSNVPSVAGQLQAWPICAFHFITTVTAPCPEGVGSGLRALLDSVLDDYAQHQLVRYDYSRLPSFNATGLSGNSVQDNAKSYVKNVDC